MAVQAGLCQTWLELQKTSFLVARLIINHALMEIEFTLCAENIFWAHFAARPLKSGHIYAEGESQKLAQSSIFQTQ